MVLYKYRSLQNFERFVDILINRRLYAAPFLTLNDPMEGRYLQKLGRRQRTAIRRIKPKHDLRIVSLSRIWNSTLMWSHYADNHKGVVIAIKLDDPALKAVPLDYVEELYHARDSKPATKAAQLLLQKHKFWQHEDEYRIIAKNREYVSVKIVEITLGIAVDERMSDLIIDLVEAIAPKITVTTILKRGLDVVWKPRSS